MKNHHYLTSGVLESYLLGLVSNEEKQELERTLTTDQDIMTDLSELEEQMELYFLENAVPPPPGTRTAIEQRIYGTEIQKRVPESRSEYSQPAPETEPARPSYVNVEFSNTHIQVHKNWRTAFIAVFILSKVFLILGLYFYFKSSAQEQEIIRLKASAPETVQLPSGKIP